MTRTSDSRLLRRLSAPLLFLAALSACARSGTPARALETALQPFDPAGYALVYGRDGKIEEALYGGFSDTLFKKPVDGSTFFRVASLSKLATALTAMKLVEEGLLKLDEDAGAYLDHPLRHPAYPQTPVTVRMLLSHTSGLKDGDAYNGFIRQTFAGGPVPGISAFIHTAGDSVWRSVEPGTSFGYCNFAYAVLGTVLEKASGARFDRLVRSKVLEPAGIPGSFNPSDLPAEAPIAALFRKTGGTWIPQADHFPGGRPSPDRYASYAPGTNALIFGPQGSLRITAEGMFRLLDLIRPESAAGRRLLPDSLRRLMTAPAWSFDGKNGDSYGGLFTGWGLGVHRTSAHGRDAVIPGVAMTGHPGEAYGLLADAYTDGRAQFVFIISGTGAPHVEGKRTAFYSVEEAAFDFIATRNLFNPAVPAPDTAHGR